MIDYDKYGGEVFKKLYEDNKHLGISIEDIVSYDKREKKCLFYKDDKIEFGNLIGESIPYYEKLWIIMQEDKRGFQPLHTTDHSISQLNNLIQRINKHLASTNERKIIPKHIIYEKVSDMDIEQEGTTAYVKSTDYKYIRQNDVRVVDMR